MAWYVNRIIPFYFTPLSPMMLNIKTGWGGIRQRENEEIVVLVSSLPTIVARGLRFLFTDRHAYLKAANYYSDLTDLTYLDWTILRNNDFKADPEDPGKMERYMAEALVYRHLPMEALLGIVCYSDAIATAMNQRLVASGSAAKVITRTGWYF